MKLLSFALPLIALAAIAGCSSSPSPTPSAGETGKDEVAVKTETVQKEVEPVKETPAPSPTPEPLTEAEQFKQLVLQKVDGPIAYETIKAMDPDTMLSQQKTIASTVLDANRQGMALKAIKEMVGDQLQVQQGYDEKHAFNVASAIIDGSLAWNRGERPIVVQ